MENLAGETKTLKISVLADSRILLDGNTVSVTELRETLSRTDNRNTIVWYYRQNATGEPPPVALDVLKLITGNKLPVRLSSRPDFSDTVAPRSILEQLFMRVREKAAERQLVIVRPNSDYLLLPALDKAAVPPQALAAVERLLPPTAKRSVAVIADTGWTISGPPDLKAANQAIPFFGLLMGFTTIGHAVWIFDARATDTVCEGAREADVLIVDGPRLAALPPGWQAAVVQRMRTPQILAHDRATHQLRKV